MVTAKTIGQDSRPASQRGWVCSPQRIKLTSSSPWTTLNSTALNAANSRSGRRQHERDCCLPTMRSNDFGPATGAAGAAAARQGMAAGCPGFGCSFIFRGRTAGLAKARPRRRAELWSGPGWLPKNRVRRERWASRPATHASSRERYRFGGRAVSPAWMRKSGSEIVIMDG